MKLLSILLAATLFSGNLTKEVNPFVGSSNFGATNPGAVCPNGLMSVSPFNVSGSVQNVWDKDSRWWSTPYSADNKYFTGFSHVNLSGVGCPELGAVLTMATSGALNVDYTEYGSFGTAEDAEPGYYTVTYTRYGIKAEASCTLRSGIERYSFPAGQANLIVNLGEALTNEQGGWIRRLGPGEIEGMRMCGGFGYTTQAVFPQYFYLRVSKLPKATGFFKKQPPMTAEAAWDPDAGKYKLYTRYGGEIAGDDLGCYFSWDVAEGEQICVQMGVSFVSCANARENLEAEQGAPDFDRTRAEASAAWEEALGRIRLQGGTAGQRKVFYTALYHVLLHPNILDDVNGEYPVMEASYDASAPRTARVEPGRHRYTVFSLWDTCRNVHQLLALVYPEKQADMLRSMVGMYKESGWMPKWELYGRETYIMEGDPAIPVIVDSYLKGLRDFDVGAAWEAFVKSAETPANPLRPDNVPYNSRGYIPLGLYAADFSGDNSVSHALEYYMADAALARFAGALAAEEEDEGKAAGYREAAARYRERSLCYRHYYSPESGTMRPLLDDGSFLSPFDPRQGENFEPVPGFHEGSAWNYSFYVPHDIEGLARLMGGPGAFCDKLQKVFDEGLYDPANEPDLAYPYLFSRFKGFERRTQILVDRLLEKYFTLEPDGLPGNDDTGTMSAWAVFSMMGLYPDCPGDPSYTLTTPAFDRVEICVPAFGSLESPPSPLSKAPLTVHGGQDRRLVITKTGAGRTIRSVRAGGKALGSHRISHDALAGAKTLEFRCGN